MWRQRGLHARTTDYARLPSDLNRGYHPSMGEHGKIASSQVIQQEIPLLQYGHNSTLHQSSISQPSRRRSWLQRIGSYALVVIVLGALAIFLALLFITFLWKGVNATESRSEDTLSSFWRAIVTSGWVTRSVTLSSLVIRIAIATQAGVCTSMFAALIIERTGLSLQIAPEVSIIRNSNTGPHHLAYVMLQSSLTRGTVRVMIPIIFLLATTLLSQFSSTLLLSDVQTGVIVGPKNTSLTRFGRMLNTNYTIEYKGINYWATKPAFYPVFAEYSESPSQNDRWYDTGNISRALPPFSTLTCRNSLKEYSGMANIVDIRTACIRPSVNASVWTARWVPMLTGSVTGRLPVFLVPPSKYSTGIGNVDANFNCTIPLPKSANEMGYLSNQARKEWPVSLCRIRSPADGNPPYDGAFLVINTTVGTWLETGPDYRTINRTLMSDAEGPWLNVRIPAINLAVSLSLCFTRSVGSSGYVNMMSTTPHDEPALEWDLHSMEYDTYAIRKQFDVLPGTRLSLLDRGVLQLAPDFDLTKKGSNSTIAFQRVAVDIPISSNRSAAMCTYCMFSREDSGDTRSFWTHRNLVAVFQDILLTTRNPALALQSHYFTLLQMAYYDFLSVADVTTNAHLVFFEDALMPRRWRGYMIFVSMLFGHLVCVVLSLVLFLNLTRLSNLGNSWQSIGQAVTSETETILKNSTQATDSEIRKRIKSTRTSTHEQPATYTISESSITGRVGLARQTQ